MLEPVMLTPMEARLLTALIRNWGSYTKTAESLGVSIWSVRNHLASIYEKAGAAGALDLISMMWRNGGYFY